MFSFRVQWIVVIVTLVAWPPLSMIASIAWDTMGGRVSPTLFGRMGVSMTLWCSFWIISAALVSLPMVDRTFWNLLRRSSVGLASALITCVISGAVLDVVWAMKIGYTAAMLTASVLGICSAAIVYAIGASVCRGLSVHGEVDKI